MTGRERWAALPNAADGVMARGGRDALTLAIHLLHGWPATADVLGGRAVPERVMMLAQSALADSLLYKAPAVELGDLPLIRGNPAETECAAQLMMAVRLGLVIDAINALADEDGRATINGMADITAALALVIWGRAGAAPSLIGMRAALLPQAIAPIRVAFAHERQQRRRGLS